MFILLCQVPIYAGTYIDNGNGTITDISTGLIWQKCSIGQNNISCSGVALTDIWTNAINECENLNLGGNSNWRLPNINELKSLLSYTISVPPIIDNVIFPNSPSGYYWSSTTYAISNSLAWAATTSIGSVNANNKTNKYYIRCITSN
jgi:hypothetical protein